MQPSDTSQPNLVEAEILLIEDDDFEAKAVRRGFAQARIGNRITRAEDGIEALKLLRGELPEKTIGRPVILLVDINMPRMNGIEFLSEVRKDPTLRRLLAFILTTSEDERDIASAYDLNVAGYIVKSSAGADFKNLITLISDYWTTVHIPRIG